MQNKYDNILCIVEKISILINLCDISNINYLKNRVEINSYYLNKGTYWEALTRLYCVWFKNLSIFCKKKTYIIWTIIYLSLAFSYKSIFFHTQSITFSFTVLSLLFICASANFYWQFAIRSAVIECKGTSRKVICKVKKFR